MNKNAIYELAPQIAGLRARVNSKSALFIYYYLARRRRRRRGSPFGLAEPTLEFALIKLLWQRVWLWRRGAAPVIELFGSAEWNIPICPKCRRLIAVRNEHVRSIETRRCKNNTPEKRIRRRRKRKTNTHLSAAKINPRVYAIVTKFIVWSMALIIPWRGIYVEWRSGMEMWLSEKWAD